MKRNFAIKYVFIFFLILGTTLCSHGQNFSGSGLSGSSSNNPTSLQFGPDGRLYVAQQNGEIKAYTVNRDNAAPGSGSYSVSKHYVGTINDANGTYYGGHPAPIQAFPSRADIIEYEEQGNGNWVEVSRHTFASVLSGVSGYFNTSFSTTDFPDRPEEGEYLADNNQPNKINILDIIGASTNGITEYSASNFDGAMKGDILTASFNGNIYRYKTDNSPDQQSFKEAIFGGLGSQPLDVNAQGDSDLSIKI